MSTKWQWRQNQQKYITVECPTCGSQPGRYCVTLEGSPRGPGRFISAHTNRMALALKVKYGLVEP